MQTKSKCGAKYPVFLAALLIGATVSESALAHGNGRGRVSIGVSVGAPFAPYPFYRPYYSPFYHPPMFYPPVYYAPAFYPPAYYPPVVVMPPVAPPVYVEPPPMQRAPAYQPEPQMLQPPAESAPQSSGNVWYFCAESKAYYPYVKQCPAGWQQVTPQPQG